MFYDSHLSLLMGTSPALRWKGRDKKSGETPEYPRHVLFSRRVRRDHLKPIFESTL